ncbi:MAG: MBG domain-containing protein [Anaerolineae bacterium]
MSRNLQPHSEARNRSHGSPYTITATLGPAGVVGNYTSPTSTANFTINKKAASVTPNATNKTCGDPDPTFTGTLSGFLVADGVSTNLQPHSR